MFGAISEEREVSVPAGEAWKIYGTLRLAKIVGEALPNLIEKIEVVEGDGGAGTVTKLCFPPGAGLGDYKEKFTVVDDEKRVKETEVVEGGYLDIGFSLYRVRFEVIEKEGNSSSCITKSTIEYEVKEEFAANASYVSIQPLVNIMEVAANCLVGS
ncbi:S-norcoclaurine synthase 2-like [Olea europaea subsp. europaea]|nr:S-norcoclaurine synthase 2-like [Olea europaea subsp. europaea]CAA3002656.1 S-norcoclaurine synthase 2-like [Olea europaea subsp. europaea]